MNVRGDLSEYFNSIIEYVRNKSAIEELEQFFEKWQDPVCPDEAKPLRIRLHYLRLMRETYELTERLNDLIEKMASEKSKQVRQAILEIVALWSEIQENPEYEDWRVVLHEILKSWLELSQSPIVNQLMNSYEELHQLLWDRQEDCLTREGARRLNQFTVLLQRCEFVMIMNYLAGNSAANLVNIDDNINHSGQQYLTIFNLASDKAKVNFIIDLHNHFLETTNKTLKKVDQNILFDKLNEQQQDRFRMFVNNEGVEFNDSRETESMRLRVIDKAEAAAKKRLSMKN